MLRGIWNAMRQPHEQPTPPLHYCEICSIVFTRASSLKAHNLKSSEHAKNAGTVAPKGFWCQDCKRVYSRKDSLARHQQNLQCRGNFAGNAPGGTGHTYHIYTTRPCSHAGEVDQREVLPVELSSIVVNEGSRQLNDCSAPGPQQEGAPSVVRSEDEHVHYSPPAFTQATSNGRPNDGFMLRDMSHQSDIMGDLDCNDHVDSEAVQYVMTEAMEVNSPEPGKNNSEAMSVFSVEGHLVRLSQSSLFGHGSIKSLQWSHHDSTRSRIASMVTVGTKSTMSCEMPAPGGLPMDRELAEHRQQENGSALRVRHRVFVKSLNRDILPKCGDMDANRVDLVKKMLQVYSIEADSDLLLHSIIYGAMLHVLPGLRRADSCTQGEKDEFVMISGYLGETQQWLCRPVFKSHRKYGRTALPVQICKPVLSRMEYWRLYNREIQVMLGQAGLS